MTQWSNAAIESYFCDAVNITSGRKIEKAAYRPPCPFPYLPAGFADDIEPGFDDIADPTDCSITYGDALEDYDKKCLVYMAINLGLLAITARWLRRFRKRRTVGNRTFAKAKSAMPINEMICWFCWWCSIVMVVHAYDIHNFNDDLPEWVNKVASQTNSILVMGVGIELCRGWVTIVHRLQTGKNEIPRWFNLVRFGSYGAGILARITELVSMTWMEKGTQHGNINALKSVTEAMIAIIFSGICWRQGRAISTFLSNNSGNETNKEAKVIKRYLYSALVAFFVAFAYVPSEASER